MGGYAPLVCMREVAVVMLQLSGILGEPAIMTMMTILLQSAIMWYNNDQQGQIRLEVQQEQRTFLMPWFMKFVSLHETQDTQVCALAEDVSSPWTSLLKVCVINSVDHLPSSCLPARCIHRE
jgi:hypothetical protein